MITKKLGISLQIANPKSKYFSSFSPLQYHRNLDLQRSVPFLLWVRPDFTNKNFPLTNFTLAMGNALQWQPTLFSQAWLFYQGMCLYGEMLTWVGRSEQRSGEYKKPQKRNGTYGRRRSSTSQEFTWANKVPKYLPLFQ